MGNGRGEALPPEHDASGLTGDERAVAAAWFSMMERGGTLAFGMKEFVPSVRAQAALDGLVGRKMVTRTEDGTGGMVYSPLADFGVLRGWLASLADGEGSFPLVVKVGDGDGKARLTMGAAFGEMAAAAGAGTVKGLLAMGEDGIGAFRQAVTAGDGIPEAYAAAAEAERKAGR